MPPRKIRKAPTLVGRREPYPYAFRPAPWDERIYPEIAGIKFPSDDTYRGFLGDKGLQVFSRYADIRTVTPIGEDPRLEPVPGTPAMKPAPLYRTPSTEDAKLYTIDCRGYEKFRIVPAGVIARPTRAANIPTDIQFSSLKMKISWGKASGGSTRIVDIGEGIRLSVEAQQVSVAVMVPVTGTTIAVQGTNFGSESQMTVTDCLALDSMVAVSVYESTSVPGERAATNTTVLRVPADPNGGAGPLVPTLGVNAVAVPSGAKDVTIYQSGTGSIADIEWAQLGPPIFGPSFGVVDLTPQRRAIDVPRPGGAQVIRVVNPDASERVFSFVFGLEV